MDLRLRPSTAELVRSWQPGWGICRGLEPGAAREVAGGDGLEVVLGLPGRNREVFALRADEAPASVWRLAGRAAAAGPVDPGWLTVVTRRDPAGIGVVFAEAGLEPLGAPERMMTADLDGHPEFRVAAPYRVETAVRRSPAGGAVVECRISLPDGTEAASGLMGVVGTEAVAHRIRTDGAHRRRGLASAVMGELCREALALGAVRGLLIASPEGERLYTSLGWTDQAAVLTGRPR